MAKDRNLAIGIDLGTTFSVIARVDEYGRPRTLPNSEGEATTPSVLLFEGTDVIVGTEAAKAMSTEMDRVAECAKRQLGQRLYDKVIGGRRYPPEVLEAWILNRLRRDAIQQVGPFRSAVITVPAYFDEVRRKATQDAGYIAGIDVLDIINEPTAAAIAFGFQEGLLEEEPDRPKRILVYDLGGGTFDVTVMEINRKGFVTLATDGDVRLGGRDWDERIVAHVAEEFGARHGFDPRHIPGTMGRLLRVAEDAKRSLTARPKATVQFDLEGRSIRLELTREWFEESTQDLLERTRFTTRHTLQAAGLEWPELDRVLMVGGSTRMPAVVRLLEELAGRKPDRSISPDEAVAHGAALHAARLLERSAGLPPKFEVQNVNSHSLGVVGTTLKTNLPRTAVLIPRNTPLPATAKRVFKTQRAGQKSILVQIVEGESANPEDCSQIGNCVVRPLPDDLPAQTPVEVRFHYADNGRLTVEVRVADKRVHHTLERDNSLTQEQLDLWRQHVTGEE